VAVQFVPVPYSAVDEMDSPAQFALVLLLYREGHRTRWGPLRWTERRLAERVGGSRAEVREVLARLTERGLITIERVATGKRIDGRRLVVLDPQRVAQPQNHERDHERDHDDHDDDDVPREGETTNETTNGTTVYLPTPTPTPTPIEQTDVGPTVGEGQQLPLGALAFRPANEPAKRGKRRKEPDMPDRYDEVARYWGEIVHRALGRRPSQGPGRDTKIGRRLAKAVAADAELVLDAMRYAAEGRGQRARWLRGEYRESTGVETILAHVDDYAELYRAERQPGARSGIRGRHPDPTADRTPEQIAADEASAAAFAEELAAEAARARGGR
jgi:hypothetical protein